MKPDKPIRFSIICILSVLLAAGLGFQSAGIALTRKMPMTAAGLFSLNGLAEENAAAAIFSASLNSSGDPEIAAVNALERARSSYEKEPLTPEAIAILALSEPDEDLRSAIIAAASRINRRETILQGIVLQENVAAADYLAVVQTLDEILLVKPSRSDELFPVLLAVFAQPGAVEEFSKVIDGSSPWHLRFLKFAVRQPEAIENLAELRIFVNFDDLEFDQALLRNLAREGEIDTAHDLYLKLSKDSSLERSAGELTWVSLFDPFDWQLTDGSGFRAQESLNSNELDLYVRSGNGGVFARRIIKAPQGPVILSAEHDISPLHLSKDVKIAVTCAETGNLISEAAFQEDGLKHSVSSAPRDCEYLELILRARAWSGQPALRGKISPIKITM